jgi:hypothetical protein
MSNLNENYDNAFTDYEKKLSAKYENLFTSKKILVLYEELEKIEKEKKKILKDTEQIKHHILEQSNKLKNLELQIIEYDNKQEETVTQVVNEKELTITQILRNKFSIRNKNTTSFPPPSDTLRVSDALSFVSSGRANEQNTDLYQKKHSYKRNYTTPPEFTPTPTPTPYVRQRNYVLPPTPITPALAVRQRNYVLPPTPTPIPDIAVHQRNYETTPVPIHMRQRISTLSTFRNYVPQSNGVSETLFQSNQTNSVVENYKKYIEKLNTYMNKFTDPWSKIFSYSFGYNPDIVNHSHCVEFIKKITSISNICPLPIKDAMDQWIIINNEKIITVVKDKHKTLDFFVEIKNAINFLLKNPREEKKQILEIYGVYI